MKIEPLPPDRNAELFEQMRRYWQSLIFMTDGVPDQNMERPEMDQATEYVCEWCKPSDLPGAQPQLCRIWRCARHGRTWHWPRENGEGEVVGDE